MPKYEIEATAPTVEVSGWTPVDAGQYCACIMVEAESEKEALEKADVLFRETDESNELVEIDTEGVLEMFDSDDEDFEPTWEVDYKKVNYKIVEVSNG